MKIFEESIAPNARRVRIFLAEKGMTNEVEFVQLDLKKGENLSKEFRAKNPLAKIPVLELDDGTVISESIAICRYIEAMCSTSSSPSTSDPSPSLFGTSAKEQALIEMWQRRCEIYFLNLVGMAFQHTSGYFADRMTPIKEWGEQCAKHAAKFFVLLDRQLEHSAFVAGDDYSIADITALCAVDFSKVIKLRIDPEATPNLKRWYDAVSSRPSARA